MEMRLLTTGVERKNTLRNASQRLEPGTADCTKKYL